VPTTVTNPVNHPLGPPTISGSLITVDTMLNQPTRVTRLIMDLSLQRFIADRVFTSAGGVTGGAVIYDQAVLNQLYLSRDVKKVAPGEEFPLVTSERLTPKVAVVEKWGGKTYITDEARDRNNSVALTNQLRQLTNTIIRKINARAIAELEKTLKAFPSQIYGGHDWNQYQPAGTSPSKLSESPLSDLLYAQALADKDELGVTYDTVLLNPLNVFRLRQLFSSTLIQGLDDINLTIYSSNRVPVGEGYIVASGQVGEMRVEKPLATETWREPETERNWIQAGVRPVMYVTNPYSVRKITGIGTS
jgi:hypothetical protein